MQVDERLGVPTEGVTHWGISRIERGDWQRLDHPGKDGVREKTFPLEELTPAEVRRRWGAGEYKVHWFALNPDDPDPKKRTKGEGHGPAFLVDPLPDQAPAPVSAAALPSPSADIGAVMSAVVGMMRLADDRATSQLQALSQLAGIRPAQNAAPAVDPAIAAQLAALQQQNAVIQAELAAEKIRREERERFDVERRRLEDENRRLLQRARDAERDADRADDGPTLQPGNGGLLEQLGYGLANFAMKNPNAIAAIAAPILQAVQAGQAGQAGQQPPPSGSPAPRQVQPPPQQRPAPVDPNAGAQAHMPSVPMQQPPGASPPSAAAGAPVARETGATVPVVGANGANHPPARVPPPVAPPAASPPPAQS